MNLTLKPARLWHGPALGRMALESKAFWGYDHQFLVACARDLHVPWLVILKGSVFIAAADSGDFLGFYAVEYADEGPEMTHLFVKPRAIGQGFGRLLWNHALQQIRTYKPSGQRWNLTIHADPHAAGFYEAMGATRTGEAESSVQPGRFLPVFTYPLEGRC